MKAVEALPVVYRHRPFSRYLHATACSFRNVMKSKKAKHLPSTSPEALNKIKTNRGKKSTKQMSKGAAEQRDAIVSDRERRRRTLDPLVWDAKTAEIMLLYKDDDVLALNKPAGLAVHGGPSLKDDLSQHLSLWQYDAPSPPELAHRLDKGSSGVLLLTRHAESAKRMAALFRNRRIVKKYWAITVNVPEEMEGSIKIPLGMKDISTKRRGRHSMNRACEINCASFSCSFYHDGPPTAAAGSLSPQGSPSLGSSLHMAETYYKVMSVSSFAPRRSCLILAQPVTGYKHQLRVHLADGLMCPVLGDYKFGGPLFRLSDPLRRKMKALHYVRGHFNYLHAAELEIPDYFSQNRSLIIKSPPPSHFIQSAKMLGLSLPSN